MSAGVNIGKKVDGSGGGGHSDSEMEGEVIWTKCELPANTKPLLTRQVTVDAEPLAPTRLTRRRELVSRTSEQRPRPPSIHQ